MCVFFSKSWTVSSCLFQLLQKGVSLGHNSNLRSGKFLMIHWYNKLLCGAELKGRLWLNVLQRYSFFSKNMCGSEKSRFGGFVFSLPSRSLTYRRWRFQLLLQTALVVNQQLLRPCDERSRSSCFSSFDDSKTQTKIVAEGAMVGLLCLCVSVLHLVHSLIQVKNLLAGSLEFSLIVDQRKPFVKDFLGWTLGCLRSSHLDSNKIVLWSVL